MVADLFHIVIPSVLTRSRRPGAIRTQSLTHDGLVIDVVHRTRIEGRRAAEYRRPHQRDADLPPALLINIDKIVY